MTMNSSRSSSSSSSSRNQSNKTALMDASGQTDAERRRLRHAQRRLQKEMLDKAEQMEDCSSTTFDEIRNQSNQLFAQVRFTREAVLDGENLDLMAARAARQVDKLMQVPRYDPVRFSKKLRDKLSTTHNGSTSFDWTTLGTETGACFNALPSQVQFLNGPLQADYTPKQHKKPVRRVQVQEALEEEQPENVQKMDHNANQLSAVERSMKVIHKVLRKRCKETAAHHKEILENLEPEEKERERKRLKSQGTNRIEAIPFLFHPQSFTQTVENIFHFSFLVKQGRASLKVMDGRPLVNAHAEQEETPAAKQAIVAFNMRDWRRLTQAYRVTQGDLPHRSGSKSSRKNKPTATAVLQEVTPSP